MWVNGEISRKSMDPEFKVNQAAFYAATPDTEALYNKDAGAFYKGSTPWRDQHTYNKQKKTLQKNAEKMLHKSHSHAVLQPERNLDWKMETKKFYGIDE